MEDNPIVAIMAVVLIVVIFLSIWITHSYFEARTYRRLTGQQVSTFDAMWVSLRVQEPVRREGDRGRE